MLTYKLFARLLGLIVLALLPSTGQAQTPAGARGIMCEFGTPGKAGTLSLAIPIKKDSGLFQNGSEYLVAKVSVPILLTDTAVQKATKIKAAIDAVIATWNPNEQPYLFVHQVKDGNDNPTNKLLFINGTGAKLAGYVVSKDETQELDQWSRLQDVRFLNEWPFSNIQYLDDPVLSEGITDGLCMTYDITGVPTGGCVNIVVDGEHYATLDTSGYVAAINGCFAIENELVDLLNDHPLISAVERSSLLSPDLAGPENPADGVVIELVALELTSIGINVLDGGLVLRTEMLFTPGPTVVGNRYCEPTTNSTGLPAVIWPTMDLDTGPPFSTLDLEAVNVPDQFGVFFAGPDQIYLPFGEGFRCVGGEVTRLTAPALASGNLASTQLALELLPIELWAELNVQYWFRDPEGGGAQFNLSDAVHVVIPN